MKEKKRREFKIKLSGIFHYFLVTHYFPNVINSTSYCITQHRMSIQASLEQHCECVANIFVLV